MQKIDRVALPVQTEEALQKLTKKVLNSQDRKAAAVRLWRNMAGSTKAAVVTALLSMSTGLQRCMYCEDSEGTDVEHFWPKSAYPDKAFMWMNYLLACARCNSNYKRTKFPLDLQGNPLLIDPTSEDPVDHLVLTPTTGEYLGKTPEGINTIDVCGLNRQICMKGRENAWTALAVLMPRYAYLVAQGATDPASKIMKAIREYPFQSVRAQMAQVFERSPRPEVVLGADLVAAFEACPELRR